MEEVFAYSIALGSGHFLTSQSSLFQNPTKALCISSIFLLIFTSLIIFCFFLFVIIFIFFYIFFFTYLNFTYYFLSFPLFHYFHPFSYQDIFYIVFSYIR